MRYTFGRSVIALLALVAMLLGVPRIAEAGNITYVIQNYPADQNGASLSGTITTDGTIGVLTSSDILSWSWTITPAGESAYTITSSDPGTLADLRGPIAASLTSITEPDTIPGQPENFFALIGDGSFGGPVGDLEYDHETGDDYYLGQTSIGTIWGNTHPVLNGGEPWVIATVSSVPEPSTLTLLGIAAACLVGYVRRRAGKQAVLYSLSGGNRHAGAAGHDATVVA